MTASVRWWETAACREVDTNVFYDVDREPEAAAICAACPVLVECRADLVATEPTSDRHGYRAGMSAFERDRGAGAKRHGGSARRPIKHGTRSGYQVHRNRGEEPCEDCKAASRAVSLAHYHAKKQRDRSA